MTNLHRSLLAQHISRRSILRNGAALLAANAVLATGAGRAFAQPADSISFLTYGGLYGESQKRAMIDPFTAESGVAVKLLSGQDAIAVLVGETRQATPSVDVVALADVEVVTAVAQGGLLAEFDAAAVPNAADLPDIAKSGPHALNIEFDSWGIAYRTDKMEAPTSWASLFDAADPTRVAFQRPVASSGSLLNMLAAAVISGGKEDNVLSTAIAPIKALREKGGQFVDASAALALLQNDGADIATIFNNETFYLADQGLPINFAFPKEGVFPIGVWLAMPANLPPERKEVAQRFINHMLSPAPQVAMSALMYSGPTNKKADVGEALRNKVLSASDMSRAYPVDWKKVSALQDSWLAAWNREIAG